MQNVLIVSAHPEPQSFNVAMRNLVHDFFAEKGDQVEVSDLYAMRFNPVASAGDFCSRQNKDYLIYALEQRHGWNTGTLVPDIEQEVKKLMKADLFVLVFPIFWFSVPAIMKGWIDRVLLSGLMFGGRRFYDRGGLKNKRALVICSMGGREHMFGENAIHGELEYLLSPLQRGTLQYVGFDVLPPFIAWHVPYLTDDEREGYLQGLHLHLENLKNLQPLPLPSLDDFDDIMKPLK